MVLAHATLIFSESNVEDPMQAIFNGIITNDKFCMSRMKPFQLSHAHKLETHEVQYPSETSRGERLSEEETHEKTAVESSAFDHRDHRRQAPMESSLSVPCSMERANKIRKPTKSFSPGEQR